jgi:3-phosphoshikimate 1-carboxyvinyltransferase
VIQKFSKVNKVFGTLSLPGDKSISHRALFISSLADGKSEITNLSNSSDIRSTINCLKELGIGIDESDKKTIVDGRGFKGFKKPSVDLNAGNSGTTARLLTGILAVQNFDSKIIGDQSLSSRPMARIAEPLIKMAANIKISEKGTLPVYISAVDKLKPINYQLPVPSAQVKSAILLAGLHLDEETKIIESVQTRNHTENLLGLNVIKEKDKIISSVSRKNYPEPNEYFIPGDISSAMYFIVLALLSDNSQLILKNVSLNSTRIECLNILKQMGGDIEVEKKGESNQEDFGDIIVKSSDLSNVKISKETIPLIIDEIPALTIAGIFADGNFEILGAKELRVKESDRINALCINLNRLGLDVEEYEDGFSVSGNVGSQQVAFDSFGDHRIAMSFAVLSSILGDEGEVDNFDCVKISNPDYLKQLHSISG